MTEQFEIQKDKLDWLAGVKLAEGKHESVVDGACAMEAVSYIAGEEWSDSPQCVSPVIGAFLRRWNDDLPDDDRQRLLMPLIPEIVGTRSSDKVEEKRAYMVLDWLVRTNVPTFLDLIPGLRHRAKALRELDEITTSQDAAAAVALIRAARDAAWAAARDSARAAAGDAARAAAWNAARAAAWDAARDSARAAAGDAARAAAWAARDAAQDAVAPVVSAMQLSAADLVRKMAVVR
jgi:hypothetical protein